MYLSSCKKDNTEEKAVNSIPTILDAKRAFEDLKSKRALLMTNSAIPKNTTLDGIESLDWDNATSFKDESNTIIIEVPAISQLSEASIINHASNLIAPNVLTKVLFVLTPQSDKFQILIAKIHLKDFEELKLEKKELSNSREKMHLSLSITQMALSIKESEFGEENYLIH